MLQQRRYALAGNGFSFHGGHQALLGWAARGSACASCRRGWVPWPR